MKYFVIEYLDPSLAPQKNETFLAIAMKFDREVYGVNIFPNCITNTWKKKSTFVSPFYKRQFYFQVVSIGRYLFFINEFVNV